MHYLLSTEIITRNSQNFNETKTKMAVPKYEIN